VLSGGVLNATRRPQRALGSLSRQHQFVEPCLHLPVLFGDALAFRDRRAKLCGHFARNSQASSPRTSTPPAPHDCKRRLRIKDWATIGAIVSANCAGSRKGLAREVLGTAEVAGSSTCLVTRALIEPPAAQQYTALNCDLHRVLCGREGSRMGNLRERLDAVVIVGCERADMELLDHELIALFGD